MAVVALAAPLLALALAGTRVDPVVAQGAWFPPLPASVVELVVVWSWHTPWFHHWARPDAHAWVLEQGLFCTSALYVWLAAFGGGPAHRDQRRGAGVLAMLLTSMHMTLLGAVIALAPRPLLAHHGADALSDQQRPKTAWCQASGRAPRREERSRGGVVIRAGGEHAQEPEKSTKRTADRGWYGVHSDLTCGLHL